MLIIHLHVIQITLLKPVSDIYEIATPFEFVDEYFGEIVGVVFELETTEKLTVEPDNG